MFSFSSAYKGTTESENATKNYIKIEICKNFYLKIPLYYHFFDNKAVLIYDFNSCNFILRLMRQPLFLFFHNSQCAPSVFIDSLDDLKSVIIKRIYYVFASLNYNS